MFLKLTERLSSNVVLVNVQAIAYAEPNTQNGGTDISVTLFNSMSSGGGWKKIHVEESLESIEETLRTAGKIDN